MHSFSSFSTLSPYYDGKTSSSLERLVKSPSCPTKALCQCGWCFDI